MKQEEEVRIIKEELKRILSLPKGFLANELAKDRKNHLEHCKLYEEIYKKYQERC